MRDSSNFQSDPLSDLLDFLQAHCQLSGQLIAGGAWARRFTNLDAIKFCAVTDGSCWYSIDGMSEPARLDEGDVLITNGTRTLTLASTAELVPEATSTSVVQDGNDQYRLGEGSDFTMLGGMIQIDAERQTLLLNGLPPLIHVRGVSDEAKPIAWLLGQLVIEMKSARPGRLTAISGLAQLLFTQTIRAYLAHAPDSDEGWLKGFGDPRLVIVLSSIHSEPSRNWGLEELAKKAGMSRTSLAVRFRKMIGVPPLTYLTQWRMYLARRELRAGASISEAAASVGYTSDSAFSNAFKRVMSVAPAQYRKAAQDEISNSQVSCKDSTPDF
ncbi:AraC family transcriptional regulator [Mangrovibacter phragmitis]|uniref:AraC family transcriptional regulator n=1 Tax=Mangrovibacter phragmitis TaxID=1691903 RepID=A0A1B7L1P0_9ENTR|nr:AraC family transcriptional regulator [Mangrovibacter phragmitis]OAT76309.1 AraC family transcriptional regulator [Mangrovibacter phragmitis]